MIIFLTIMYGLFISIGVLGVGFFIWQIIRNKVDLTNHSSFKEQSFLTLGIAWFIGYFAFEGVLYISAISHIFYPLVVIALGFGLSFFGCRTLWQAKTLKSIDIHPLELITLIVILGYVMFWNLYPTFDVDSISNYLPVIRIFLEHHGVYFSRFNDVRFALPLGENMMSALGFAWSNSTFFTQLMHGFTKLMFLVGVYGAARSIGLGTFSLIAPALVASEEHFVASGANLSVHLNINLLGALFFLFYGLIIFCSERKRSYLMLSFVAVAMAVFCKYFGLIYLFIFTIILFALIVLNKDIRAELKDLYTKNVWFVVLLMIILVSVAFIPYVLNLIWSGTPLYPVSLGPFKTLFYDANISEIARIWHYHLSLMDAFKNFSAFMVWPGVLPLKILCLLAFAASLLQVLTLKTPSRMFVYGMILFAIAILMVVIQQWYIVYEMRYYRFGIGLYALSCVFFIAYFVEVFIDRFVFLSKSYNAIGLILSVLLTLYCLDHSHAAMGSSRPTKSEILDFLTTKKSEAEIYKARYADDQKIFELFKALDLPSDRVGLFIPVSWPQTIYPLKGKTLSLFKAAAFPTITYFDEHLLALELKKMNVQYVLDLVSDQVNPWHQGANKLFSRCGKPLLKEHKEILELSSSCLDELALKANNTEAKNKVSEVLSKLKSKEEYNPFQKPEYGGFSGLIN